MQEKYPLPQRISDYTIPEIERFRALCNFTETELKVFNMETEGRTISYMSRELSVSDGTVSNYIRKVKKKMRNVIDNL